MKRSGNRAGVCGLAVSIVASALSCSPPLDFSPSEAEVYAAMHEAIVQHRGTRPAVHPHLILVEDRAHHPAEYADEPDHFLGPSREIVDAADLADIAVCELAEGEPWCARHHSSWVAFSEVVEAAGAYTAWANYVETDWAPSPLYSLRVEVRLHEGQLVATVDVLEHVN